MSVQILRHNRHSRNLIFKDSRSFWFYNYPCQSCQNIVFWGNIHVGSGIRYNPVLTWADITGDLAGCVQAGPQTHYRGNSDLRVPHWTNRQISKRDSRQIHSPFSSMQGFIPRDWRRCKSHLLTLYASVNSPQRSRTSIPWTSYTRRLWLSPLSSTTGGHKSVSEDPNSKAFHTDKYPARDVSPAIPKNSDISIIGNASSVYRVNYSDWELLSSLAWDSEWYRALGLHHLPAWKP